MAKRITLTQFAKDITKHHRKQKFTRQEIRAFAAYKGVTVPSEIWDSSVGRNLYSMKAASDVKLSRPKINYSSITKDKSVDELFEDLNALMQVISKKKMNSLIITGNAGIGKTHTVIQTIEKQGLARERDYLVFRSKTSPLGLYMTLFLHHDKVIVFDDLDDLFTNDDCASILKAALDSYDVREISWSSKKMQNVVGMDATKRLQLETEAREQLLKGNPEVLLPNRFVFKGQIVFISNLSSDKFDKAVLSRSMNIDMSLSDHQVFSRMKSIADELVNNPEIAKKSMMTIIDKYNDGTLAHPNMRTVLNYANVLQSGISNPERLSKYC